MGSRKPLTIFERYKKRVVRTFYLYGVNWLDPIDIGFLKPTSIGREMPDRAWFKGFQLSRSAIIRNEKPDFGEEIFVPKQ